MPQESTTPDPVALTHRVYASLNSRDLDAIMGLISPACVWDASRWDLGTHTGPHEIRRFAEEWLGGLDEYGVQVEEMRDLGNGVIYVLQLAHRAATAHGYLELRSAPVLIWVDGLLAQATFYSDPDEARAAAERLAEGPE
jgi:ketosteroid isomerase-like protein